ncbi:unnamed protein product [Bursaphelenchus okinawaensis]|uniref:Uncharacterized protein n=1 Tax=Bursaphelenchus okinawaensis TaxID=465554 RepID=A0A811KBB8_9BILA|nr:unnamed protein product [Bursaphelenchus okinawaensis]CAG9096935.1 unnamed protein product [Bursaphelenchus okinawaensis]
MMQTVVNHDIPNQTNLEQYDYHQPKRPAILFQEPTILCDDTKRNEPLAVVAAAAAPVVSAAEVTPVAGGALVPALAGAL